MKEGQLRTMIVRCFSVHHHCVVCCSVRTLRMLSYTTHAAPPTSPALGPNSGTYTGKMRATRNRFASGFCAHHLHI